MCDRPARQRNYREINTSALRQHALIRLRPGAGGLDTFRKFFDALPANNGMAFVLIQHLDPKQQSLMVDLLTGNTPMKVLHPTSEVGESGPTMKY